MSDAPRTDDQRANDLFDAARALVGERLADCRHDRGHGWLIMVVDLTDEETDHLRVAAVRLGIAERVRIERADRKVLDPWERLRHDLIELQDRHPNVLLEWKTPKPGDEHPPVYIHLEASALAVAVELHERYRGFVSLQVGSFRYPLEPGQTRMLASRKAEPPRGLVDQEELTVRLDGHLSVRSGETVTHALLLLNTSDHTITVDTNGSLTAAIVDPETGTTVGGFTGFQIQPLISFTAHPGETVRIPLLVGTASFDPDLGYTVPAGAWQLVSPLDLRDGRRLRTPALELTVVD